MPDLENYDDILDGEPQPDEVQSDTRVSPLGDEIDESVKSVKEEIVEEEVEKPSKTEEPKEPPEDTEEEPSEQHPLEKQFYEAGLDKQFKGGLEELLRRVPDMNKYITALEAERKTLRDQMATREPEPRQAPSADDLYNDPSGVISKIVDEKIGAVNEKLAEMEVKSFVNSKPDFDEMQPLMREQLEKNPGLGALGYGAVPVLYQMAKATQLEKVAADAAKKASQPVVNKESAETSVSKKAVPIDENSMESYKDMSIEEMRRKFGYTREGL
jgi:hypothetical protein